MGNSYAMTVKTSHFFAGFLWGGGEGWWFD